MPKGKRVYENLIKDHMSQYRQMALVAGSRQVGKTTLCRALHPNHIYLNWDNRTDRKIMLLPPHDFAQKMGFQELKNQKPIIVLDELHKYRKWKSLLKGLFDTFEHQASFVATGSAKLNINRKGSDSLMGRYFLYRVHPFSVAETLSTKTRDHEIQNPKKIKTEDWNALLTYGGFPEPYFKRNKRFWNRWQDLRTEQLIREDIRALSQIQDLDRLEVLAEILTSRSGQQLSYSTLANEIDASVDSIRRWVKVLSDTYFGFLVRPWFKNIPKSLRKEPKWFVSDWSKVENEGQRLETMVACHLLKAVQGWKDMGLGDYALHYIRDTRKREVDFLVVKNKKPWFLVEVKQNDKTISKTLGEFQKRTEAEHAFQVVFEMDFVEANCFDHTIPIAVPAKTFLSQHL